MGKSKCLYFIITLLFVVWLFSVFGWHYKVMAEELTEKAEEIIVQENGYISSLEEDQEDADHVLSDTIQPLEEVDDELQNDSNNQEDYQDNQDGDTISSDQSENEEVMTNNDDQFRIMVIFCFGLTIGVITGRVLLGFF